MPPVAGHRLYLEDTWSPWRCAGCGNLFMFKADAIDAPCPCPASAAPPTKDRSAWPWIAGAALAAIAAERGCPLWAIPLAVLFPPVAVAVLMAVSDREG